MGGRIAFLSRNADEHHQIVMASGRAEGSPTTINQLSFRVGAWRISGASTQCWWPRSEGNRSTRSRKRLEHLLQRSGGQPHRALHAFAVVRETTPGRRLDLSEPAEVIRAKNRGPDPGGSDGLTREAWMEKLQARLP